jgi:transcriptional regulator with XRE-family HTH domain
MTNKQRGGFGTRLYNAREKAGLSQQEMADAIGIHLGTYGNWETGRITRPDLDNLRVAVDILRRRGAGNHIDVGYLLHGETANEGELERLRSDVADLGRQLEDRLDRQMRELRSALGLDEQP